jgi:hypothetical protein
MTPSDRAQLFDVLMGHLPPDAEGYEELVPGVLEEMDKIEALFERIQEMKGEMG